MKRSMKMLVMMSVSVLLTASVTNASNSAACGGRSASERVEGRSWSQFLPSEGTSTPVLKSKKGNATDGYTKKGR